MHANFFLTSSPPALAQWLTIFDLMRTVKVYQGSIVDGTGFDYTFYLHVNTNEFVLRDSGNGEPVCSGTFTYVFPSDVGQILEGLIVLKSTVESAVTSETPEICENMQSLAVTLNLSNASPQNQAEIYVFEGDSLLAAGTLTRIFPKIISELAIEQGDSSKSIDPRTLDDNLVMRGLDKFFARFDTEVISLTGYHLVNEATLTIYPVIKIRGDVFNAVVSAAYFEDRGWFILSARAGEFLFPNYLGIVAPTPF